MAGVADGQAVSAAVTNAAYIYKNATDTVSNTLTFTAGPKLANNTAITGAGAVSGTYGIAKVNSSNQVQIGDSQELTFTGTGNTATFTGPVQALHLVGTSSTPGIAAGTGAGTSPTISITGTDVSGQIVLTTGSAPAGSNATIATITFATAYATAPKAVIICPANNGAAGLAVGQVIFPGTPGTTSFTIVSGATALAAATGHRWNYMVL